MCLQSTLPCATVQSTPLIVMIVDAGDCHGVADVHATEGARTLIVPAERAPGQSTCQPSGMVTSSAAVEDGFGMPPPAWNPTGAASRSP